MLGQFTLKHCLECVNCSVVVRIDTEEDFNKLAEEVKKLTKVVLKKPNAYPAFWFSANKMVDRTWVNQHSYDLVQMNDIEWNLEKDIYTLVSEKLRMLSDEGKVTILNHIENLLKEERKEKTV